MQVDTLLRAVLIFLFSITSLAIPFNSTILDTRDGLKDYAWIGSYDADDLQCLNQHSGYEYARPKVPTPGMEEHPGPCMPLVRVAETNVEVFYGTGSNAISGMQVFFDKECKVGAFHFQKDGERYACVNEHSFEDKDEKTKTEWREAWRWNWGSVHGTLMPDAL